MYRQYTKYKDVLAPLNCIAFSPPISQLSAPIVLCPQCDLAAPCLSLEPNLPMLSFVATHVCVPTLPWGALAAVMQYRWRYIRALRTHQGQAPARSSPCLPSNTLLSAVYPRPQPINRCMHNKRGQTGLPCLHQPG